MNKKSSAPANQVVNPFVEKHHKDIMGVLHSFDRLRLQGSLRHLYCAEIFEEYLSQAKVLYKDFKQFATGLTLEVCQRAERSAIDKVTAVSTTNIRTRGPLSSVPTAIAVQRMAGWLQPIGLSGVRRWSR